LRQHKKTPQLL